MMTTSYSLLAPTVLFYLAAALVHALHGLQPFEHTERNVNEKVQGVRRVLVDIGSSGSLTMDHVLDTHQDSQGVGFQLKTAGGGVAANHPIIPKVVLLTGPAKSLAESLQHRGELATISESLGITPDMHVRYFDNLACRTYLEQYFPKLVPAFDTERHGSYKGDICRAAVLAREGGFYVDLDMQLRTPLRKLVDNQTTFMTARSAYGGALNAIIATVPNNPVMFDTLAHIERWYSNETLQEGLLGPATLQRALEDTMKSHCPQHHWENVSSQFECGPSQSVRLFSEEYLGLEACSRWGPTICPEHRAKSELHAAKFGLFHGPVYGMAERQSLSSQDIASREECLIGWPRFEDCAALGCGLSGGIGAAPRRAKSHRMASMPPHGEIKQNLHTATAATAPTDKHGRAALRRGERATAWRLAALRRATRIAQRKGAWRRSVKT